MAICREKMFRWNTCFRSLGVAIFVIRRELELSFMNLQEYEDHAKKLYKEVKRYEECVLQMHKLEQKMSSEMSNSPLCQDDEELKKIAGDYQVTVS